MNRCVSVTLPVHQLRSTPKFGSWWRCGLRSGFNPPSSFTPFSSFQSTLVGTGPSATASVEYMCQPSSIVAVNVITP